MITWIIFGSFFLAIIIVDYLLFRPMPETKVVKRKYKKVSKLRIDR